MRPLVARRGSSAAQGTAAGGTSTADCLWLRDVGGGEIDQPTALTVHLHRAQGQPRRYSPVSERTHVRAQLAAHTHTETTERCHTTHACARRSAELLNIHSGPRSAAGAPREVRASPPCRATFGDSATRPPRASGSAPGAAPSGSRTRPRPCRCHTRGGGPRPGTRWPSATRARARRCSPRPNAGALGGQSQKKLPAA